MADMRGLPLQVGDRVVFVAYWGYEPVLDEGTVIVVGDGYTSIQPDRPEESLVSLSWDKQIYRLGPTKRESDHGSA